MSEPKWGDMDLRAQHIHAVLDGDRHALVYAFTWYATPQGSLYWIERHDGVTALTAEDIEFLKEALVQAIAVRLTDG